MQKIADVIQRHDDHDQAADRVDRRQPSHSILLAGMALHQTSLHLPDFRRQNHLGRRTVFPLICR
jgi:hypothetical protein